MAHHQNLPLVFNVFNTMNPISLTCTYLLSALIFFFVQTSDVCSSQAVANNRWDWKLDADKALELHGKNGLIWRLNFGKNLNKFYFHPLRTVDGKELTWVAPPDHIWHYGLWFSWKTINGVNYWEIPRGKKYPEGRTLITKAEVIEQQQNSSLVRIKLNYRSSDSIENVATGIVELWIETPRQDGSYAIDWTITIKALQRLNFGKSTGYGGLSHRAAESLKKPVFLSKRGQESSNKPWFIAAPAPWMDFSALSDGTPVGLTIFNHPTNPRSPSRWFIVNRLLGGDKSPKPFYYNNSAILATAPLSLDKGETMQLRYRTLIHSGRGDTKSLQAEAARFAEKK